MAEGTRNGRIPQRLFGRDLFWWLDKTGLLCARSDTALGARLHAHDGTIVGSSRRRLRELGVRFRGRVCAADGDRVRFDTGERSAAHTIVWATGFRHDDRWIHIDGATDETGQLMVRGGLTAVPRLYPLGRPWQYGMGSSLIGFVGSDADHLAGLIATGGPASA